MSLADSILFATALENDWELASRNVNDFKWVASLRLLNPFDFRP
jgi:predicted nucleic acid-binding protein